MTQYYLVKQQDANGVSIAIFKAESETDLQQVLNLIGVSHEAEIHHIENLEFNPLGFHEVYSREVVNGENNN